MWIFYNGGSCPIGGDGYPCLRLVTSGVMNGIGSAICDKWSTGAKTCLAFFLNNGPHAVEFC